MNEIRTAYERDKEALYAQGEAYAAHPSSASKAKGYAIIAYCKWREYGHADKNIERYIYKALYYDPEQPIALWIDEQMRKGEV